MPDALYLYYLNRNLTWCLVVIITIDAIKAQPIPRDYKETLVRDREIFSQLLRKIRQQITQIQLDERVRLAELRRCST